MKQMTPLIKEARFNEAGIQNFFEKIGTTKEELLERIQRQVEKDPNKDKIIRNLNIFQKKR